MCTAGSAIRLTSMCSKVLICAILAPVLVFNTAIETSILSAQQVAGDSSTVTVRANTRLVMVDVVVTDRKGQPVSGLKADDFTLEENGKRQKVAVFVPPETANGSRPTPLPAGVLSNRPENVTSGAIPIVLVLDAANSAFRDQAYARSQMLKYVVAQEQASSPMAILTLTDRLRVLQEFTSDPQILLAAIKNYKPQEQTLRLGPTQSGPSATDQALTQSVGGVPGSDPRAQVNATRALAAEAALQDFMNTQVAQYAIERRTLITLEAMRTLCHMLGGLPGRKNVVWLTSDLPFELIPEDRSISDAQLMADLPSVRQKSADTNAVGALASGQREMHSSQIREVESELASASIAIYPVDLNGLVSGMEGSADQGGGGNKYADTGVSDTATSQVSSLEASHATMEEVAAQTGGKAYINQNEIKDGIALAASDEKASYAVGYYPENKKWDGKLRTIKVKIARGDVHLRYRKGYFAIEPRPAKEHNYEQDVAAALQVDAPATQVIFMAQAKPSDPGKMTVVFLIDARTLTAEDVGIGKKISANLYATIWGSGDKSLAERTIMVDKSFDSATYLQMIEHGMTASIEVEIPAGGKELRLAVLDNQSGSIGTVSGALGQ